MFALEMRKQTGQEAWFSLFRPRLQQYHITITKHLFNGHDHVFPLDIGFSKQGECRADLG